MSHDAHVGTIFTVKLFDCHWTCKYLSHSWHHALCKQADRDKYPYTLSVNEWAEKNAHFKALRDQNVKIRVEIHDEYVDVDDDVDDDDGNVSPTQNGKKKVEKRMLQENAAELMVNAVNLWTKRCCHHWKETHLRIDDAVEATLRYLLSTMEWVDSMVESLSQRYKFSLCPFQIDLCMVFDEAINTGMCIESVFPEHSTSEM